MRIGVNARLLQSDRLEGIGRYLYETLQSMAKNHPEDEFILFFDRPFDQRFINAPNLKGVVVSLPTRHPLLILIWFEWLLPSKLKEQLVDVFYSADNFLSLRTKIPTILVCHDLAYKSFPQGLRWDYLWFYKTYMPKYLHRANKIVTVSEFVKKDIIQNMDILAQKIVVAYNALPHRPSLKQKDNDVAASMKQIEKPYFVFVGALHPRKNLVNLIKAYELFTNHNGASHQLVIIGKLAWQTDEIIKRLKTPGVVHLQNIKENQLMIILQGAAAMIYPSFFEGFGIPILEGFAAQIPVITSSVSSMPEVGGNAVLLVDPNSTDSICDAMEKVTKDLSLARKMVTLGNERLKDFDWQKSGNIIYQLLLEIHRKNV